MKAHHDVPLRLLIIITENNVTIRKNIRIIDYKIFYFILT